MPKVYLSVVPGLPTAFLADGLRGQPAFGRPLGCGESPDRKIMDEDENIQVRELNVVHAGWFTHPETHVEGMNIEAVGAPCPAIVLKILQAANDGAKWRAIAARLPDLMGGGFAKIKPRKERFALVPQV